MTTLYLDFEYIESQDRTTQKTISVAYKLDNSEVKFTRDIQSFVKLVNELPKGSRLIAYNVIAEIVTLLREGVTKEKLREFDWIDLWIEAKMFMLTHDTYFSQDTSLKDGALKAFKIAYPFDMKQDPIKIILSGNGTYSEEEWQLIEKYNKADVNILPLLLAKLKKIWKEIGVKYHELTFRGKFALENAISYHRSNGFPMDAEFLKQVFERRAEVKYEIAKQCNEITGCQIYRAKVKKRPHEMSFSIEGFTEYLSKYGLIAQWGKTDTNKVSTTENEFEKWMQVDTYLSANKTLLESIYYARSTIKQLNSTDLSKLLTVDGYIKSPPFPFHQKSGRSSPKPALGFILNLAPWLRNSIKPKPGMALISADWSQQEIALAGFFSQDQKLLESYKGDHYITNAIACGFAPEGATKKSHPKERELMKPTSLGIIYGMGVKSMAFRVEAAMGWIHDKERVTIELWDIMVDDWGNKHFSSYEATVSERAYKVAKQFIDGHKAYYGKYWEYVDQHAEDSISKGYYKVPMSGWYYFLKADSRPTQLQNIPCQAGGAAVMQKGFILASDKYDLSVVCSLHDALYVECPIDKVEETKEKLLKAMAESVDELTNGTVKIRNEVKVYTAENPYDDPRGLKTYELIKNLIGDVK